MKKIAISIYLLSLCAILCAQVNPPKQQQIVNNRDSFYLLSPVEVKAIRAADIAPFSKTNISKSDISKANLGQDIPFLLNQTPSVVINSDAGNGIGYTGIRIRGTDATRINITLNGIPYNDAESQGTFFVDLPDFTSSINSVQILRGTGTSSNGAGSFGGSINFSTNDLNKVAYAEFNNSFGSFNSWKNTFKAGTGLLGDHFTTDIRLSRITSEGFIDRAASHLASFHLSSAYSAKKYSVRFNIFSGKEKTYQAWYGISEADLKAGNRTINYAGMEKPGTPYGNETDNYWQDHYQLFFNSRFGNKFSFNTALFFTKGKGFYEQYKSDQSYSDYGLTGMTSRSDFIRKLWLDNDFYGNIFSLQYKDNRSLAVFGGAVTRYAGRHFGELVWASNGLATPDYRWYDLDALKTDFTIYGKEQLQLNTNFWLYADLQYRHVNYNIDGFQEHPSLFIKNKFNFLNPKAGISFSKNGWKGYFSFGIANKEPNRDDFEARPDQQPRPERLYDFESGIERTRALYSWSATLFYMRYKDQLVLTGRINDVGAYSRTNIPESYRLGMELQGMVKFNSWMNASGNIAISRNKVTDFSEFIDDYDNGGQQVKQYKKTDIAYSPAIVSGITVSFLPLQKLELALLSKYVSKQFLDNTEDEGRKLNPFITEDIRMIYTIKRNSKILLLNELNIIAQVNNIFNKKYEPNGYTYNYISGSSLVVNNYYFPMAGVNFMVGVNVRL